MNQKLKRMRQILVVFCLTASVLWISSCDKYHWAPEPINLVDTIYFQTDIQPIFTANCLSCHGAIQPPILKAGKAYQNLIDGGFVTAPGESSKLYMKMTASSHSSKSTDAEKQKVLIWINQGALDN